ncbi:MAG: hypothetical protein ACI93R_001649 [Flavobacteriales bacterium]|jgi:hypothetical protein
MKALKIITGVVLFCMSLLVVNAFGLTGGPAYIEAMAIFGPLFILNVIGYYYLSNRDDIIHGPMERKTYRIFGNMFLVLGAGLIFTYFSSGEVSSVVVGAVILGWGVGLIRMNPADRKLLEM